jgi:hypothetical protein
VHQLITGIDLDGLVIRFTDAFLPNFLSQAMGHYQTVLFNNVTINHTLPVPPAALPNFEALLGLLLAEFEGEADGRSNQEVLRHLLTVLLVKVGPGAAGGGAGGGNGRLPRSPAFPPIHPAAGSALQPDPRRRRLRRTHSTSPPASCPTSPASSSAVPPSTSSKTGSSWKPGGCSPSPTCRSRRLLTGWATKTRPTSAKSSKRKPKPHRRITKTN